MVQNKTREEILKDPGFGNYFTDHMVSIIWEKGSGWGATEVLPYGPITMDPAASVLHYGQEIFEGLKAYRSKNNEIQLFRVGENARRLRESARRLALPELPDDRFIDAVETLLRVDHEWVPAGEDMSLYLRPFMYADESFLGVRPAHRVRFLVIASPAGPYFAEGVKPVSIWLSENFTRAGHGGTGAAKCGGNYAASLLPQQEAVDNGCAQVLFLEAGSEDTIDELGGMNLFLVKDDNTLITPALTGNILPGITRDSLITLAKKRGYGVEERKVTVSHWRDGVSDGSITEAFACGTAAVITPIQKLKTASGQDIDFGDKSPGNVTMSLRNELTGIQTGEIADNNNWVSKVEV